MKAGLTQDKASNLSDGKLTCTYTASHTPVYTSLNLTTSMHNLFATFPTQMATMISGKEFVVVFLDNVTSYGRVWVTVEDVCS